MWGKKKGKEKWISIPAVPKAYNTKDITGNECNEAARTQRSAEIEN